MLYSWQERVIKENFNKGIKRFMVSSSHGQWKSSWKWTVKIISLIFYVCCCSFFLPSHFTVSVHLQNMQLDPPATAGYMLTQTSFACIWHGLWRVCVSCEKQNSKFKKHLPSFSSTIMWYHSGLTLICVSYGEQLIKTTEGTIFPASANTPWNDKLWLLRLSG